MSGRVPGKKPAVQSRFRHEFQRGHWFHWKKNTIGFIISVYKQANYSGEGNPTQTRRIVDLMTCIVRSEGGRREFPDLNHKAERSLNCNRGKGAAGRKRLENKVTPVHESPSGGTAERRGRREDGKTAAVDLERVVSNQIPRRHLAMATAFEDVVSFRAAKLPAE